MGLSVDEKLLIGRQVAAVLSISLRASDLVANSQATLSETDGVEGSDPAFRVAVICSCRSTGSHSELR